MKRFIILSISLFALLFGEASAQTHLGINFTLGFPQKDFKQNTEAVGAGANISALFPLFKKSPLFLGFDLGYQIYGYRTYRRAIDAQIISNGQVVGSIPMNFQITNSNNLLNGHLVGRFKLPLKYVQPYVDGMVGFKNLYTRTTIEDLSRVNYNPNTNTSNRNIINSRTNLSDWAFSYGYGGGLMFMIGENVSLDVRVTYLHGGEARYFDKESTSQWDIRFVQGTGGALEPQNSASLNFKRSNTDMIFGQLGFVFHIPN